VITDVLESIDLPDGSGSVVLFYPKCAAATDGQTLVRIDLPDGLPGEQNRAEHWTASLASQSTVKR